MQKAFNIFSLLIVVIFTASCGNPPVSQVELYQYLEDQTNELSHTDSAGGIVYNIMYKPTDLLVYQEVEAEPLVQNKIDSLRKIFGEYNYYVLKVSANDKELLGQLNHKDFIYMMQELSFHMPSYVKAVTHSKDTIELEDFYTPRLYGMGAATEVLLAFKKQTNNSQTILIKGLNGGNFAFHFNEKNINAIPQLSFNSSE